MARKNINSVSRYLCVLQRKNSKAIEATGWFDDRATGSFKTNVIIPIDNLNAPTTNKIAAGQTYVGLIENVLGSNTYSISTIYPFANDEFVYLVCKDLSKKEEATEFVNELAAFYGRSSLNFNVENAVKTGLRAVEEERPLIMGAPIRFQNVSKIIASLKIPTGNYSMAIVSKSDVENGVITPVLITTDSAEDWNLVYSPEPLAAIEFDDYVMPESLSLAVSTILPKIYGKGKNFVMGFIGDSGNGKTAAAANIARYLTQKLGREISFDKINVPAIQRPTDFFLQREFRDGATVDDYTKFYELLTNGNAVILLDEANRVPADILNVILGITDGSEYFFLRGKDHKIGKNITFILAFNVGYEYTGTFDMDKAMLSRMNVRIDFALPAKEELYRIASKRFPEVPVELLNGLTVLCHHLHGLKKSNKITVDVSIRALLNWCFILEQFDYRSIMIMDALQLAIVNFGEDDEEKATLTGAIKTVLEANGVL